MLSLGTCFGKFTKSGKFRLHITALDYISQYAKVIVVDSTAVLVALHKTNGAHETFSLVKVEK